MKSLWNQTVKLSRFPTLEKDIKTDVLIIGGGLAGLLCAHRLKEAGAECVLVEANEIFGCVSGNTTAKITSQHGLIYGKLVKTYGVKKARKYYLANEKAIGKYRTLCKNIDCDFEEKDNFVYSIGDRKKLAAELAAIQKIGVKADFVANAPLPFDVAGAVRFSGQAQFHPKKFARAVAEGLNIYEHTRICSFDGKNFCTYRNKITAKKTVVATHFPIFNKHGMFFMKLYQHRSYVLALENAQNVNGMYVDESDTGLSFRNYGHLLLLGGGSHHTGKSGGGFAELEKAAAKFYPDATVKYRWATQDCMTLDSVPYIGRYSENTPDLFVATGFNKWGMTSSMVAADILCDLVRSQNNEFAEVFSPSRTVMHPRLFVNAFHSASGLLTPTVPRCPHMGCALKWNKQEYTWDCPCHGSRFTADGKLIDNPATGNMKK